MRRVAVVDDDEDVRFLMDAMLGEHFDLLLVPSGDEALERLPGEDLDAVLIDYHLGDMLGVDLLTALRADPAWCGAPAGALTARTEDRQRLLDAGFDGFLPKQFADEGQLKAAIDQLCELRG